MHEFAWRPTIGDPSAMGWITVAAYFATAASCVWGYRAEPAGAPLQRRAPWIVLACAMVALGVNKQLDLQTMFTEIGRVLAHRFQWYEGRRAVQAKFVEAIAGAGLAAIVGLSWATRGELRRFRVALLGLAWVVCYVVIRAASFHRVDVLIRWAPMGVRMNWVFELSGIAIVAVGTWTGRHRAGSVDPERGEAPLD